MAKYPQITYVRVKDRKNGNEFTTSQSWAEANKDAAEVIDKPAVNGSGDPLPAKPKLRPRPPAKKATAKKAAAKRTTKKATAKEAASNNPNGGVSASNPEEGSK